MLAHIRYAQRESSSSARRKDHNASVIASVSGSAFLGNTPVGYIVLLGEPRADWDAIRAGLRAAVGAVYRAWAR